VSHCDNNARHPENHPIRMAEGSPLSFAVAFALVFAFAVISTVGIPILRIGAESPISWWGICSFLTFVEIQLFSVCTDARVPRPLLFKGAPF
jgi:hypothetical protein